MKIAVSSTGKGLDSEVSSVFGRCPYFLIIELNEESYSLVEVVENKGAEQSSGAGISAAQLVAEKGVAAVISGNIGPRASDVLRQFDIRVYIQQGTVRDVLERFAKGELKEGD